MVFTYPTPAAPPERYTPLESNTVAFLVSPDDHTYNSLLETLPKVKDWVKGDQLTDAYNTESGTFQGLINAVFWDPRNELGPIYFLPYQFGLSTNKLSNERTRYFVWWRKDMLRIIEFIDDFPIETKARMRHRERTKAMLAKKKLGWPEKIMNEYFTQFWMDLQISLDSCKDLCKEFNFKTEIETSRAYVKEFGPVFREDGKDNIPPPPYGK